MFSPRAWGWSAFFPFRPSLHVVLPTRVGMVRTKMNELENKNGSPHARGDGPRAR